MKEIGAALLCIALALVYSFCFLDGPQSHSKSHRATMLQILQPCIKMGPKAHFCTIRYDGKNCVVLRHPETEAPGKFYQVICDKVQP